MTFPTVRTRFAPSPTGSLHVGGVRTALFCWLHARRHGGEFVLRIEDTDRARSTQESVDAILHGLEWLGIDADEGPIYQSDRLERYTEVVERLLDEGKAYKCYCSPCELDEMRDEQRRQGLKPRYNRRCRDGREPVAGVVPVVRFKTPLSGDVVFDDLVRGSVRVANDELDDLVIFRGDGTPTYNFAVVVDDADMAISHVIRGDDHINNTPRQINIFQALGLDVPTFAHVPMILGDDGARLSKRHGAVGVTEYRDAGYLPEALVNYLVRLGWSHGDQEIFSRQQMIDAFDLVDVNRSASTFNTEKLDWLNSQYIKHADIDRIADLYRRHATAANLDLRGGPDPEAVCELWRERVSTLRELLQSTRFLYEPPVVDEKAAAKHLGAAARPVIDELRGRFAALSADDWRAETINAALQATATELGVKFGKVAAPTRLALSGTMGGADLDRTIELLGQERVVARLSETVGALSDA